MAGCILKLTDESGANRLSVKRANIQEAMSAAREASETALAFGQCQRVFVRDCLGGLRAELWRDETGIQYRKTK